MITELSPLLKRVSTEVQPEALMLQKDSWVHFTDKWPGTWDWAKGKTFRVSEEPILVKIPYSYILPGSDYKDLDLSNADNGLNLYPEEKGVIYECAVGFKPGDYITHLYVPKDKYVFALGEASMWPDITDASKKYFGAKAPDDSPASSPLLFLYFIKDGPAFYLRPYILESETYEKVSIEFQVNKCKLTLVENASEDMVRKAKRIAYYSELSGF